MWKFCIVYFFSRGERRVEMGVYGSGAVRQGVHLWSIDSQRIGVMMGVVKRFSSPVFTQES